MNDTPQDHPTPQDSEPTQETPPEIRVPTERIALKMPTSAPMLTFILIGITVSIFAAQIGTEYILGVDYPAIFGMKINEMVAEGQFWRLLTPVFLHGGFLHIGFNMYALYLFGPTLERHFGRVRFLILYFLSGFAGNVISLMFTEEPSLGSSTAIFGLLGAQGIFLFQNRDLFGSRAQRAIQSIVSVALINLFIGLSPGIDNWGHVGGLIGGTLFTWFAGPLLKIEGTYPKLFIKDHREQREIIQAAAVVSAFFIILAAGTIIIWKQV